MYRCRYLVIPVALIVAGVSSSSLRADLHDYIKKPDPAFSWKIKDKIELPQGTVYTLHLVSQTWQGITWEHPLQVFVPKGVEFNGSMFLWNQGGRPSQDSIAFGMELAVKIKAPVALLFGVPNQPLLGGKTEDALIAETFVRYLKTKDGDWPLLFPMVKSLVRAMDALQQFAKQELKLEITRFIVSGGSKRGWTTWLTAAADARVQAIAPLVIDTLNFQLQIPHQFKSFGGKFSAMIKDYTERGLVPMPDTPEARKLWMMVDPWHYRDKVKVPTMIINGANDPYWTTDALNLYWKDVQGPKWVLYVPNAGHNLQQKGDGGKKDLSRARGTLAAFSYHQVWKKQLPQLTWKHDDAAGKLRLRVDIKPAPPKAARLWVAKGPTRDLRFVPWEAHPATIDKLSVRGEVAPPEKGYLAFYGEVDFEIDGLSYYLSTQMRIVGPDEK